VVLGVLNVVVRKDDVSGAAVYDVDVLVVDWVWLVCTATREAPFISSCHVNAAHLGWQVNEPSVKSLRFFDSGITLSIQIDHP
jgi:hypothetical protein